MEIGMPIDVVSSFAPTPRCTESESLWDGSAGDVVLFSLSKGTDITPEIHPIRKAFYLFSGSITPFSLQGDYQKMDPGELFVCPSLDEGIKANEDSVYLEIPVPEEAAKEASPFELPRSLTNQIPCPPARRILNMDLLKSPKRKMALMGFGPGSGLSEHAAPGEALLIALEGRATIGYEGKKFTLKEGEVFRFAKWGRHSVFAQEPFKMALLLDLA